MFSPFSICRILPRKNPTNCKRGAVVTTRKEQKGERKRSPKRKASPNQEEREARVKSPREKGKKCRESHRMVPGKRKPGTRSPLVDCSSSDLKQHARPPSAYKQKVTASSQGTRPPPEPPRSACRDDPAWAARGLSLRLEVKPVHSMGCRMKGKTSASVADGNVWISRPPPWRVCIHCQEKGVNKAREVHAFSAVRGSDFAYNSCEAMKKMPRQVESMPHLSETR